MYQANAGLTLSPRRPVLSLSFFSSLFMKLLDRDITVFPLSFFPFFSWVKIGLISVTSLGALVGLVEPLPFLLFFPLLYLTCYDWMAEDRTYSCNTF